MPFIPLEDFLMETFDEETRQEIEKELEKIKEEAEEDFSEEQHMMRYESRKIINKQA